MHRVIALIGLGVVAMPAMPQPARASSAAVQRVETTSECTRRVQLSERYRTRRHRVTSFYFQYRNVCDRPIRLHHCNAAVDDVTTCALAAFRWVDLEPGQTHDVRDRPDYSYELAIECRSGEPLVEVRSRVTGRSRVHCQGDAVVAEPEANPGAAFSGVGDIPDLSLPEARPRPGVTPISASDYPLSMQRIGAEGRTKVALAISATGRVTGCRVTQSSGFEQLDRTTCDLLMRRGRFLPATDANGNPTAGVLRELSIGWARD